MLGLLLDSKYGKDNIYRLTTRNEVVVKEVLGILRLRRRGALALSPWTFGLRTFFCSYCFVYDFMSLSCRANQQRRNRI